MVSAPRLDHRGPSYFSKPAKRATEVRERLIEFELKAVAERESLTHEERAIQI